MVLDRRIVLAAAAALLGMGGAAAADLKSGDQAWQAGDYATAIREWTALAQQGNADAQYDLGQAYRLGKGVPANPELAESWISKAARQGHPEAEAIYGLMLHTKGQREAALPWLRKAADRGDPRAQYVLGIELFNGDLLKKDWPRAYALVTRAADRGLPQAIKSLSEMDQFLSPADKQQGTAMAKDMGQRLALATAAPALPKAPRIAGSAPSAALPPPPVAVTRPMPPIITTRRVAPPPVVAPPPPAEGTAVMAAAPKHSVPAKAARPAPAPRHAAAAPAPAEKPAHVAAGGGWRVQLGAFSSAENAHRAWQSAAKAGGLGGLHPSYQKAGSVIRLQAGSFASRSAAEKACASAKAGGQACFPVAP
jgi:cell division septation protein DedD